MKIYTKQEFEAMQVSALSQNTDNSSFETACAYFRQICSEIGSLIGNSEFRGGYDDMPIFYAHEAYKTDKGVQLAIAWAGVNDLCKYEASKLGIGSPDWWYKCWEAGVGQKPLYYNLELTFSGRNKISEPVDDLIIGDETILLEYRENNSWTGNTSYGYGVRVHVYMNRLNIYINDISMTYMDIEDETFPIPEKIYEISCDSIVIGNFTIKPIPIYDE